MINGEPMPVVHRDEEDWEVTGMDEEGYVILRRPQCSKQGSFRVTSVANHTCFKKITWDELEGGASNAGEEMISIGEAEEMCHMMYFGFEGPYGPDMPMPLEYPAGGIPGFFGQAR